MAVPLPLLLEKSMGVATGLLQVLPWQGQMKWGSVYRATPDVYAASA